MENNKIPTLQQKANDFFQAHDYESLVKTTQENFCAWVLLPEEEKGNVYEAVANFKSIMQLLELVKPKNND